MEGGRSVTPVAILGRPAPLYDMIVSGPFPIRTALWSSAAQFQQGVSAGPWLPRDDGNATPRDIWVFNQGGGGVTQNQIFYRGISCRQTRTTVVAAIDSMSGLSFMPVTDISGLAPSFANPTWRRVNWLRFNLALEAGGALDRNTGLLLTIQGGQQTTPIWPIAPAVNWFGGFGITGDGAGNWNFDSFAPDFPGTLIESVSLSSAIPDPDDWNTFDFVMVSGAGGRPARFELHINEALFLQRGFGVSPLLPGLGPNTGFDGFRYSPVMQIGTTTNDTLYAGDWEFKAGRFLTDGRELFK